MARGITLRDKRFLGCEIYEQFCPPTHYSRVLNSRLTIAAEERRAFECRSRVSLDNGERKIHARSDSAMKQLYVECNSGRVDL